jgi:predicted peptidase
MRTLFLLVPLAGMLFNTPPSGGPRAQTTGLLTRTINLGAESYTYQIYVPGSFQANQGQANQGQTNQGQAKQRLPVLLMLHGIGQRGVGGFVPSQGPTAAMAKQFLERVPAIVLLPQCRPGRFWHNPDMEQMVMAELDQTVAEFGADTKRLYLTGVSMGGFGLWHLASRHPGKFAALVSICGGSPVLFGERFKPIAEKVGETPVWLFHGDADPIVPVTESRQMAAALKAVPGSRVRYSEYKGVGHDVWMKALNEPELLPWIFAQHLD